MKRMKIFLVAYLIGIALLFISCDTSIFAANDVEIKFDSAGHVKEAVAYTVYNDSSAPQTQETISYSKDGAYEDATRTWDGGAWTQSDGYKGTYAYDTATRLMTINYSARWATTSYANLDASSGSEYKTMVYSMMLGKRNQYSVYAGTAGSYSSTATQTRWNGIGANMKIAITVSANLSSYTMLQTITGTDASGTITGGMQWQSVYTVDHVFPSGVTTLNKAKGQTITLTTNREVATTDTWVSGSTFAAGTAVTYDTLSTLTMSFSSNGTLLAMDTLRPFARSFAVGE